MKNRVAGGGKMDASRRHARFDACNVSPDDRTPSLHRRNPALDGSEVGLYGSEVPSAIEAGYAAIATLIRSV